MVNCVSTIVGVMDCGSLLVMSALHSHTSSTRSRPDIVESLECASTSWSVSMRSRSNWVSPSTAFTVSVSSRACHATPVRVRAPSVYVHARPLNDGIVSP